MPTPAVQRSASLNDESETDNSDDNEQISLPDDTLAILQQFLKDKADREKFEDTAATAAVPNSIKPTFQAFEENWVSTSELAPIYKDTDTSLSTATKSILVQ